jgi:hypothetical protein
MELTMIQQKIHEIRGQKVMLDFDLAVLYEVQTKVFKQAVKRNRNRFPPDFMFELTTEEFKILRSQFVTSSWGGTRYMPFAFTEQGVAMLSSVLNSDKAIAMNISIVRAFIDLRHFALHYNELADQIQEIRTTVEDHGEQLVKIYGAIETLLTEKEAQKTWDERERIGYK